jgi:hypothetical protein
MVVPSYRSDRASTVSDSHHRGSAGVGSAVRVQGGPKARITGPGQKQNRRPTPSPSASLRGRSQGAGGRAPLASWALRDARLRVRRDQPCGRCHARAHQLRGDRSGTTSIATPWSERAAGAAETCYPITALPKVVSGAASTARALPRRKTKTPAVAGGLRSARTGTRTPMAVNR